MIYLVEAKRTRICAACIEAQIEGNCAAGAGSRRRQVEKFHITRLRHHQEPARWPWRLVLFRIRLP
jgi:hypothetical protein